MLLCSVVARLLLYIAGVVTAKIRPRNSKDGNYFLVCTFSFLRITWYIDATICTYAHFYKHIYANLTL